MKRNQLPLIRLASWEHLPYVSVQEIEAPSKNVVPFEWGGETFQVAGRFAYCGDGRCYLFARIMGEEDEANWVLASGTAFDEPDFMWHDAHLKLSKRLSHLEKSRVWPFGRLFFFRADELKAPHPFSSFISAQGRGCWIPSNGLLPWSANTDTIPFRLPLNRGESLRHTPARDVRARVLESTHDADSDARFALDWCCQTEWEREKWLFKVEHGSIDELRHLLLCALRLEPTMSRRAGHWSWLVGSNAPFLDYWPEGSDVPDWIDIPLRLRLWSRFAYEYFVPSADNSLLHRHLCARQWNENRRYLLHITTESPTQHERLEAALLLRDWARDKVPPHKLNLLLSRV